MGKKKKLKADVPEKKSTNTVIWVIAAVAVVIAVLAVSGKLPFTEKETGKSFNLTGEETRPVLDPSMFTGQVRAAYAAAMYRDIVQEERATQMCHLSVV